MTIIAVRHTSVAVPAGMCYGQTDVKLATTYIHEIKKVANELISENYSSVYSSPLQRCKIIAEYLSNKNSVIYDPRLMELNFGNWEGKNWVEIEKTVDAQKWFANWIETPCPKGESYTQLISRVNVFLQQVLIKNENTLIATHSGVIRALYILLSGIEPKNSFDIKIEYGSITKFEIN